MSNNSGSAQQPPIPIFAGYYYDQWVVKMRTILIGYGLWDYVEHGYDRFNCNNQQENYKNDAKALCYIQQGLCAEIFPKISRATKAKEAWDILKTEFAGTSKVPVPPDNRRRRRDRLAPKGTKRGKALTAITVMAQTTMITRAIYEGIENFSHRHDSSSTDGSFGSSQSSSTGNEDLFAYANGGVGVGMATGQPSQFQNDFTDGKESNSFLDGIFDIFGNS